MGKYSGVSKYVGTLSDIEALPYDIVYVVRDTYSCLIRFWDCNIGILKKDGCYEFRSATKLKRIRGVETSLHGELGYTYESNCRRLIGFIVRQGEAWRVNLKTGKRTRIDQNMVLWDRDCKEIL